MVLSNIHTHTCFCDGSSAPEEYIQKALALGFHTLGFSGHSYTPFDDSYSMPQDYSAYREEILRLREKYKDKIFVALGIEQDINSAFDDYPYDFIIGSTHYVAKGGEFIPVDRSDKCFSDIIKTVYGGDAYGFVKDYFETQHNVIKITKADVVGHFDLVRKFNDGDKYFSEQDKRYRDAALSALDEVMETADIFEINSGAAARGATKTPYPSMFLLKRIKEKGKKILFSSDCHKPQFLNAGFDMALNMAKECGFDSVVEYTKNGFVETKIY